MPHWWHKFCACVRGDTAQPQHSPSTTLNASGQLDLNALLSSLHKEQQAPLTLATLEKHLAHWPPILVVQTARFHATTDAEPDCHSSDKAVSKGAKQQASLLGTFDPPSYVSMVCRLQDMAAPAGGDRKHSKHIAKLEAMRRRQGSGRVNMHEHTHMLTLSYANPALIEVLGGAEKVSHWVDVHISQNPLLLWQLSRSGVGEVYRHCLPGQNVQGGVLPLSVVLCQTHDMGPALIIGLHCQIKLGLVSCESPEGLRQPQQQKQRQKHEELGVSAHTRESEPVLLESSVVSQEAGAGPTDLDSQQQYQEYLYLAMAHLPFAVTLIDSSGQVFWQNGRSALLLGLLSGNNKARDLRQSLQQMFTLDSEALESLLCALKEGQAWSGLVQVPREEGMQQSTVENAVGVSMEGIQTLASSASAEGFQGTTMPLAYSARYQGSFNQERVPVDVSRLKSGSEWHALHQEAGPAAAGPRHRSRTLPPSLVPQAASPVGGSPAHAAAAAAGQADDQRVSSVADNIPCYKMPASAGGFSFPEKLAVAPDNSTPAVLPMLDVPSGSKADTPMLKANAHKDASESAPVSSVRLELSPASPANDSPRQRASSSAGGSQLGASSFAMPPWLKRGRRPSEPVASDPLPRAPVQQALGPALPPWLQEGRRHSQQQSAPLQRPLMRGSAESAVSGCILKGDPPRPQSSSGISPVNFRRHSTQRSVHTSGVLLEQDLVLSGASRALRMSSSLYAVGSLNYLAQSQEHAFSGAILSTVQSPAHYFDSIPEGRQEKEAQNLLSSAMEKNGEIETCAQSSKLPDAAFDTGGTAQLSMDESGKRLPQSQPSNAAQLPDRMGTSGSELKPNTGGTDCLSLDKSTTKGAEGEQLTVLADASQGDSAPSWDAHYVDRLPSSPPQKQRSHPAPAKKSSSGVSEAHGFEGRCSSRRDAQVGSASAPLLPQMSVPSIEEQHNEAPSSSWHYLDAFTIRRPDGGKVTVLTNQDVTSWVDAQTSLKQILDVEHKILEEIFPAHVLESQVAAGAEARTGKSAESGPNSSPSPMLSKRGSYQSYQSQAWSTDNKDCRSHRSSRLGCMTSDTSPASRSELLFIDGTYKLSSQKGSPFDSGASSPLPQSQRNGPAQKGLMSDRIRSMNSSAKSSQPLQALSRATTGSTEEASGLLYFLGKASLAEHGQHDFCHEELAQGAVQGTLILSNDTPAASYHLESPEQSRALHSKGRNAVTSIASMEQLKRPSNGLPNVQLPTRPSSKSMGQLKNVQAPPKQLMSYSTGRIFNHSRGRLQTALTSEPGTDLSGSQGLGAAPRDPGLPKLLGGMGRHHENVTVMFADIKNFTAMSRAISSVEVMHFLNTLFSQFDDLVDSMEHLGLYKVETIGDCYMCAAGLLTRGEDGAMVMWDGDGSPVHHLFTLAREMLEVARTTEMPASGGQPVVLRIGMHTGPVTSGIAGRKCPRFCLFGDTVNFAARMETACEPGMVHVSQATWEALGPPDQAADPRWSKTSGVMAKGIGLVQTYLWNGRL